MLACSRAWRDETGVEIAWDARSLQDFESYPVEELARAYDLIVIDHPHVGAIAAKRCLASLSIAGREAEREALAAESVGPSYRSYAWEGEQWAFPIDAAAPVQVWRPDLLDAPLASWREVLDLARRGGVLVPLRPPHSLMAFYTLAGNLGRPCTAEGPELIDRETGRAVLGMLREIAALIDPRCVTMDPIAVSERMAEEGSRIACAPHAYGYVSYAKAGFRPHRLRFANLPAAGGHGSAGSAIGGTGIAVSAFSTAKQAATDFAYWIAGAEVQRGCYARGGGQPGNAAAWEDDAVNAEANGFYRDTRATLEAGWLRPRHDGYMAFQQEASDRINEALHNDEGDDRLIDDLNGAFRRSFR
jgi:multiple sugar transport system substrate-binding protein